ncbi:heme A synthase [Paragemmobacter straminiformis]|uniref:Heme A synthase n=1 Tax=Paragemmobacter straminiformis TaxID=2045119 RepID=A0A842IC43_9RHOB|nr:heme A synthase [Gemmobacter straminiformis]MBC2837410.1 COX15/CtaA family protein [Gemmobacter straminiformis]
MAGKRSIFEEVGSGNAAPVAPAGGMIAARATGARRGIRLWLAVLFLLVAAMIAVGGLTRLTDSGLSITEWRPVTGALPPLDDAAWAAEFAKYQASPEYQLQNKGMELEAFKSIYWWEWGHRQLGRVIGLVWLFGFLGFLVAWKIPAGWTGRLLGVGALGGVQGAIGWWMVSSGLKGSMVDVASYRLATHLGIAFVILGLIAWYVFLLGRSETELMQARRGREAKLFGLTTGMMHFAFVQILLGALVAGIDAGRAFPTWPDMNGQFFPADAFYVPDGAWWRAFFENPGLVQFIHRMSGYLLFAFGVVVWLRGRKSPHAATRRAVNMVMAMLLAQVVLGIYTALTAAQVHVAITHQVGAVLLWVLVIRARHLAQYPVAGSIRKGTA